MKRSVTSPTVIVGSAPAGVFFFLDFPLVVPSSTYSVVGSSGFVNYAFFIISPIIVPIVGEILGPSPCYWQYFVHDIPSSIS